MPSGESCLDILLTTVSRMSGVCLQVYMGGFTEEQLWVK